MQRETLVDYFGYSGQRNRSREGGGRARVCGGRSVYLLVTAAADRIQITELTIKEMCKELW